MRLDRLWIGEFKNLKGFEIDFDETKEITVLVGRNGSAKSNLIEALVRIFAELKLNPAKELPDFAFRVKYLIHGQAIDLSYDPERRPALRVNGESLSLERLRADDARILPEKIVLYYSGESTRYDELVRRWDRYAWQKTVGEEVLLRPLIKAEPIHAKFAALSYFAKPDPIIAAFLRKWLRIRDFDSALITAKRPSWGSRSKDDVGFWGARGASGQLLGRIRRASLSPFLEDRRIERDFDERKAERLSYLYLPNRSALESAAAEYDDPETFFQTLDTIRLSRLVHDIRVRVFVEGESESIYSRDLSEGELQLFSVLGLMRFTRNDESLYLLDEPDTHLNPAWGLHYLDFLRTIGRVSQRSHTIIATHDPLLVAGLTKQEIRILYRDASGQVKYQIPLDDPRGRGVAAVLTSELYGLESQLDLETSELLRQRRRIAVKENPSAEELDELDTLNRKLYSMNFIVAGDDSARQQYFDALFRRFEEANLDEEILTVEQVKARRRLADEIVEEMEPL